MRVEIKVEGVTGHDDYPLLDLAAMLEEIAAELEAATKEHDVDAAMNMEPGILATTDDGEAVATVTVYQD